MGIRLSARQCIEFGRVGIMHGFFYIAIEWMETAVAKIVSESRPAMELTAAKVELETTRKAVSDANKN